ncbi:MAG: hypothetical protein JWM57_3286 [Phycisphaerales bacterium]|nr:hypothetical protein [Phycisphaerales bacterium]
MNTSPAQPLDYASPPRRSGVRARVMVSRLLLGQSLLCFAAIQIAYWSDFFQMFIWSTIFLLLTAMLMLVPLGFGVLLGMIFRTFATDEFWLDRRSKIEIAVESAAVFAVVAAGIVLANYEY